MRVVVLAEASSGKTAEFRHQQEALFANGKAAFFVPLDDIDDGGLQGLLTASQMTRLKQWQHSDEAGYFFCDAVDELRLSRRTLERALRWLARDLADQMPRTHVYISCRVSDWRGRADSDAILQEFPVPKKLPVQAPEANDPFELNHPLISPERITR